MNSILYKYFGFDENLKDSLRNGYLWFSDPLKFNDPFEFKLQVGKNLDEKDILEYFELYKKLSVNQPESVVGDFNRVMYKYRTNPEKFIELYLDPFLRRIRSFGVCCFSSVNDNILMWSHYANKHSGIVIGFDRNLLDKSILNMNEPVQMTVLDQITYSREFPIIQISSSHRKTSEEIRKVVFTKSSDWKYENEVRIISNMTGKHRFDKKSVKRIYLGQKFSDNDKREIHQLLKNSYPEQVVEIVEMVIEDRSYSLKAKNT